MFIMSSMLNINRGHLFGCSREVGWFSEGLLREVYVVSLYTTLSHTYMHAHITI